MISIGCFGCCSVRRADDEFDIDFYREAQSDDEDRLDDDEDSNDEGNWKNDYPDTEPDSADDTGG